MLTDSFGRTIRYLRVSVTDRCNLFCSYCRLPTEKTRPDHQDILDFDELIRLVRIFLELGIERVRLTGGEPLLRRNLVDLVRELAHLPGLQELSLTTNAMLLERHAADLQTAGLRRVNISLDTLNPDTFAALTRHHASPTHSTPQGLAAVLAGIKAAIRVGLRPVKVNMVVMRGINHQEIPEMLHFAQQQGVVLRYIETMPIGEAGQEMNDRFLPTEEILATLQHHFGEQLLPVAADPGSGPARYFTLRGTGTEVGVISARSRHFCDSCNRMRLTANGRLLYCLGREEGMDLKTLLRSGADEPTLHAAIRTAVAMKPAGHAFAQQEEVPRTTRMSAVGG
ncbi:MAG: GTP 3',8-cyclase MoaA [Magnetococcus sp. MYC-9]